MKPVPAGNAGEFAALPVEHRPRACRRDLDVPRRKIPVVYGRLDASPAELRGDSRKQVVPRAGPFQPRPIRGVGHRDLPVRSQSRTRAAGAARTSCCGRGESPAKEIQRQRAQSRRLERRAQPGHRHRAGRDRRQEGFFLLDQSLRLLAQTGLDHGDRSLAGVEDQQQKPLAVAARVAGEDAQSRQSVVPASPARDESNLAKGSSGETVRETLSVPSGSDTLSRQRRSVLAARARPVCAG